MKPSIPLRARRKNGAARVYVLLRTVRKCPGDVVGLLRRQPGVVRVDRLEGPPDIIILMEAPDRAELAQALMKALASVDSMIDHIELLPVLASQPASLTPVEANAKVQAN